LSLEEVSNRNLVRYFMEELAKEGWDPSDPEKVFNILIRDGVVFMPRPGYLKRCSP